MVLLENGLKCKVIWGHNSFMLEQLINKFLKENRNIKINKDLSKFLTASYFSKDMKKDVCSFVQTIWYEEI